MTGTPPPPLPIVPIVDGRGNASLAFSTWWQQLLRALGLVEDTVEEVQEDVESLQNITITGTGALGGGGDLTANRTITHDASTVTPGSYTNADITVDSFGHVTAAANGSSGAATGGVLPLVTGGPSGSYPIFVHLEDGSLVYWEL